jgi:septal ring factor EnvC (AmiA/AmiB activator)
MAKSLDDERAAIAAEEERLLERRKRLADRERDAALQTIERTGLLRQPLDRLTKIAEQMKKLGIDEICKRLSVPS